MAADGGDWATGREVNWSTRQLGDQEEWQSAMRTALCVSGNGQGRRAREVDGLSVGGIETGEWTEAQLGLLEGLPVDPKLADGRPKRS